MYAAGGANFDALKYQSSDFFDHIKSTFWKLKITVKST